jgi:ribosome-binding factor A
MKAKKPSHRQILSFSSDVGPEDGLDPRQAARKPLRRGLNRKALQLSGQIARVLSSVLAWESGDELLQGLTVESVEPAPDSTRMLVTVAVLPSAATANPDTILACLYRSAGKFRAEIAAEIHRKRVPELIFRVRLQP